MKSLVLLKVSALLASGLAAGLTAWMLADSAAPPARNRRVMSQRPPRAMPVRESAGPVTATPAVTTALGGDDGFRVTVKQRAAASFIRTDGREAANTLAAEGITPAPVTQGTQRISRAAEKPDKFGLRSPAEIKEEGSVRRWIASLTTVGAATWPVAFQPPPDGAILSPKEAAGVESILDEFTADIGGEAADPASLAYLNRWRRAQPVADQRLRAMIGAQAFAAWQAEAWLKSKYGQPASDGAQ